jgi:chaperone required for assembly of F1-ATPase
LSFTLPKRFYSAVAIAPAEGEIRIHLDGRPVRTPGGRFLSLPSVPLAEALAAEWEAQTDLIRPSTMPLTQLANTALDRIGPDRAVITDMLMGYAGTDLVCFLADRPADLVARQTEHWQPLRDWLALALDAPLTVTTALIAPDQPAESLAALRADLDRRNVWHLAAIQAAAAAAGSLVIALALAEGRIDATQAIDASQLDERYQADLWGDDYEAVDRRAHLSHDIKATAHWLALLAGS